MCFIYEDGKFKNNKNEDIDDSLKKDFIIFAK